jgi:hypothetical protein
MAKRIAERRSYNDLAKTVPATFLPAALVGRKFVACTNPVVAQHNWWGYDEFTVIGDLGQYVIAGADTYDGNPYVREHTVLVETEKGMVDLTRHEFMQLVCEHLYLPVK